VELEEGPMNGIRDLPAIGGYEWKFEELERRVCKGGGKEKKECSGVIRTFYLQTRI
jgi:hypothetical protein